MRSLTIILALCTLLFNVSIAQESSAYRLWYNQPAASWNEALPIGNGRLAAMVFGTPWQEKLQLNEETLWAGGPGNNNPPDAFGAALPEIRQMIFDGKYEEAQKKTMSILPFNAGTTTNYGMPYQTFGNLLLEFPDHRAFTNYRRELDISKAVSKVTYTVKDVEYTRETFVSFPDQVIVVRLTASKKESITCEIRLTTPHKTQHTRVHRGMITVTGVSSDHENKKGAVRFSGMVKPVHVGGKLHSTDSSLYVKKADELTLFISIGTSFRDFRDANLDENAVARRHLDPAVKKSWQEMILMHEQFYRSYFDRVSLDLGSTPDASLPTDQRLKQFATGNDPQLVSLYFQFGRYLLICSSQPGNQPATLQGKWNDRLLPPWDSKYTININTEMNYWPAEVANLTELHQPLFSMLKDLEVTGQETARKTYKARGWVAHHNTDIWRITGPVDGGYYGLWPMGGAWLSQHIWQHYLYTGDKKFLAEMYPVLKGVALFYNDVLREVPGKGWLVVTPSMSPENEYQKGVSITAGATMDNQLVFDVFNNFLETSKILNTDKSLSDTIRWKLDKLPPMMIGKHSQLQEWLEDWDRPDDKHRHISHLYGLFPSNQISPYSHPELFEAARTSLVYRGDQSTGWSMGWKVNWWARLLDGDRAYKLIKDQLSPALENVRESGGTYPNLLDAHPPFQIDGNFGCTSGIAEMLVQSHDGAVHLLPALPIEWRNGKVTGLRVRGGFAIDMEWESGKVKSMIVHSDLGGVIRFRSYDQLNDTRLKVAEGANPNPFFATASIKAPVVSAEAKLNRMTVRPVFEYDLKTEAGNSYILTPRQ